MSLSDNQWEFLQDVALLVQYASNRGYKLTGGELYRTDEQQDLYIDEGKSWVTHSQHQDRLAVDLNVFLAGELTYDKTDIQPLGEFWESLYEKNVWGGNWEETPDTPHFERRR